MSLYQITLPSAGPLVISVVALIVFYLQARLYFQLRSNAWTLWGAIISLCTAFYAAATFFQYNAAESPLTRICSQVQLSMVATIIMALLQYVRAYLKPAEKRPATALYAVTGAAVLVTWTTDLVASRHIERVDFLLLREPYYQAVTGPLGIVLIAGALATALFISWLWIRKLRTSGLSHPFFAAGIFWLLLGVQDATASLPLGIKPLMPLIEYGFIGFSLALLTVNVREHLQLVKLVQSREENLLKAKREAEDANRAKSSFLAKMSHELRTPLNHIIGFTELVAAQQVGTLNPIQREYLGDSLASSRHLLSLLNDILDLAKIEAGKETLQREPVDLEQLLKDSAGVVAEKLSEKGISLEVRIHDVPRSFPADGRRLRQVLHNLLFNAVKFTPEGGRITLAARAVHDQAGGDAVQISVGDTGIGIEKEKLEQIFKPFEQVDTPVHRRYAGTGLGLSLCRELVQLHGGRIWAESEGLERGATFHVELPLRAPAGQPAGRIRPGRTTPSPAQLMTGRDASPRTR